MQAEKYCKALPLAAFRAGRRKRIASRIMLSTTLVAGALGAARPTAAGAPPNLDRQLRQVVISQGLTGDPSRGRELPEIGDPMAQLGMQLFFSKALGGELDTACASCHHPLLGGGDAVSLSIGSQPIVPNTVGDERRHVTSEFFYYEGPPVGRNAPTTFNVGLWDSVLFMDGRVESLGKSPGKNGADGLGIRTPDTNFGRPDPRAGVNLVVAQGRFPVVSGPEMLGEFGFEGDEDHDLLRRRLAGRLGRYGAGRDDLSANSWLQEFQLAFDSQENAEGLVTFDNIILAIAEYQRSQVFVESSWKAYVEGDENAIASSAKRGALLFYRPVGNGRTLCATCHRGDFFTDEGFHVLAVPQIGRGKRDGLTGDDDFGRFRVTTLPEDRYRFRTPSLLNVEVTAPYGHNGSYATLTSMIRHHLDPHAAVESYDLGQIDSDIKTNNFRRNTDKALQRLAAARADGSSQLEVTELSDSQVTDLVAFMLTLTDPCVRDSGCLAPWVPAETMPDPDGHRLRVEVEMIAKRPSEGRAFR